MNTEEIIFVADMITGAIRRERERIATILEESEAVYTTNYGDGSSLDWDRSMTKIADKIRKG